MRPATSTTQHLSPTRQTSVDSASRSTLPGKAGLALVALAITTTGAPAQERWKLTGSDTPASDYAQFGYDVAMSGSTIVIGAPGTDTPFDTDTGAAYVFDATTGEQLFGLMHGGKDTDQFGASVAVCGNTAVIGCWQATAGEGHSNAYAFDTTNGQMLFKLPQTGADDIGPAAIAVSESFIVIGNRDLNLGKGSLGGAYVYDVHTGQFLYLLLASDGADGDQFGHSIALDGNIAVIGANESLNSAGSAYVFDLSAGQELFKLTALDGSFGDRFGSSVALSGDIAVIGAPTQNDATGYMAGAAYLFDVTTGQELNKINNPASYVPGFGMDVSIDGNSLMASTLSDRVWTFDLDGYSRELAATDQDPDEDNGFERVAMSGKFRVVGAYLDDPILHQSQQTDAGSVYVFETPKKGVFRFCPANSALVDISTSDSKAKTIQVELSDAYPHQVTLLLVGNGFDSITQPPGAMGDLCILGGSCLGRYDKDVGFISKGGTYSVDLKDNASTPWGGKVNISPGATWNFQYWYRQPKGQPSTFSEAISVTFQ